MNPKKAVIIGAGPAALTAAYELVTRTDIKPIVLEMTGDIGGISKTVNYKGNRMDIGGHRFFSKSDRVMRWWFNLFPLQNLPADDASAKKFLPYVDEQKISELPTPEATDHLFLIVQRLSRIYHRGKLFSYPISLSVDTLRKLGLVQTGKIGMSYVKSRVAPIKPEDNLEAFFTNRFGKQLYRTFFKSYTEKVWGVPCHEIDASWGAQRVKGLSISKAVVSALKSQLPERFKKNKTEETSLIEQFVYPKYGPGQLWEYVAHAAQEKGAEMRLHQKVTRIHRNGQRITGVTVQDTRTGQTQELQADLVFSTMPVRDLVLGLTPEAPEPVASVAAGLAYRDYLVVGLLLNKLANPANDDSSTTLADTWIYLQEPGIDAGRLQIYNNWGKYMVPDRSKIWVGVEYFCQEGDTLWNTPDEALQKKAAEELEKIHLLDKADVLDGCVTRMQKAYPAYIGTYSQFPEIKTYVDQFENLYLIGRNGMHQYNNMDHSMLSAMTAVDLIIDQKTEKEAIWTINTEQEYHENK